MQGRKSNPDNLCYQYSYHYEQLRQSNWGLGIQYNTNFRANSLMRRSNGILFYHFLSVILKVCSPDVYGSQVQQNELQCLDKVLGQRGPNVAAGHS